MNILTLILVLLISLAQAIPERDFEKNWKEKVLPFFDSLASEELKNAQGMTLKYYSFKRSAHKKSLVIVPGRTEAAKKYAELIYDLRHKGFDIFIMDHQGQGESDRLLADSNKGHVISFMDYVRDLEQFMNEVVITPGRNIYLIANSMGGAVSTHYMQRNQGAFTKAVLVAPMLEINTKPYNEIMARYYSAFLVKIGKGDEYAPNNGPYIQIPYEVNPLTSSEVRYAVENYLFTTWPHLAIGGPTSRWVNESLKATKNMGQITLTTPVLLAQSGKDLIVKPGRQNEFCKASFCRMIRFPEAKHEILMEKDNMRDVLIKEIGLFLGF